MTTFHKAAGIVLMVLGATTGGADTLLVPAEYPTIQGAVDAASLNDTILTSPGVYAEDVLLYNLDKPMSLIGTGAVPGDTVITGRVQAESGEIEKLRMTGLVELGSGDIAVTDCEIVGSGVNVELASTVFFENTSFTDFQCSNVHVTLSQVTFLICSFRNST